MVVGTEVNHETCWSENINARVEKEIWIIGDYGIITLSCSGIELHSNQKKPKWSGSHNLFLHVAYCIKPLKDFYSVVVIGRKVNMEKISKVVCFNALIPEEK